jgi:group I intron endonuclease
MKGGIYRIAGPSNRYYIGQAVNFRKRWQHHLVFLRRGNHANREMQADFTAVGEQAFRFEKVLICALQMMTFYEQLCVDAADPARIYNIRRLCVTSGFGVPASPERKAKVSAALKGRIPDAVFQRMTLAGGFRHTPEARLKMSKALTGRKQTAEQRAKRSRTSHFRVSNPEWKARSAATQSLKAKVLRRGTAWVLF